MPSKKDRQPLRTKDIRLLEAAGLLSVGTINQINDLIYSEGCRAPTSSVLKDLKERGYLKQGFVRFFDKGNPKLVYHLSTRGYTVVVQQANVAQNQLVYPSDNTSVNPHTIECNDPIVWAYQLARKNPPMTVESRNERILRSNPVMRGAPIGDGWTSFVRPPTGHFAFIVEWDKGSIHQRDWLLPRIEGYLQLDQSQPYYDYFGTKDLIVLWLVKDQAREKELTEMTWNHLQHSFRTTKADLFRFAVRSQGMNADQFYFAPIWIQPGQTDRQPLLPKTWRVR